MICSFHVSLQSKCRPRYLTVVPRGMTVWLILTAGHCPLRRVNFMCVDLVSLTFILHFLSQFSMLRRWSWRLREAIVGLEYLSK